MFQRIEDDNPMGTSDPEPEPRIEYEVHCGNCGWWGMVDNMVGIYVVGNTEDEATVEPACPMCLTDDKLEYKGE